MFGKNDFGEDEKEEWKIREKMDGNGVWIRGDGKRKRKIVRSNCILSGLIN